MFKPLSPLRIFGLLLLFHCIVCAQENAVTDISKNFIGTAVQIGVGYQPYLIRGTNLRFNYGSFKLPDQRYQGSSTPYFIGLSHTIALGNQATIAAQIEMNPINRQYVLSVLPGYVATSNIQAYAKIAFVNAQVSVDDVNNKNRTESTTGLTAGVGVKYLWTTNWYGFLEANYVKMNTFDLRTNLNGWRVNGQADYSGYNIMTGLGYKF